LRAEPGISVPEELPRGVDLAAPGLVFGGVSFEFLGDARRHDWSIPPNVLECVESPGATPSVAHVLCSLHHDASLDADADPHVCWQWCEGGATVRTSGVRCTLRNVGAGRYAASARLARGPEAAGAIVRALSHTILHREGGFALHASGVELDGRAVLFIGPGGAGKSTATLHVPGARFFADDQVVLYPAPEGRGGFWVSLMPARVSRRDGASASATLPVAGILRVDRGTARVGIRTVEGPEAFFLVRESVRHGSPGEEEAVLDRVAHLIHEVPVGVVTTVLGEALTATLSGWLPGSRR
jgi:hypothetical protein